MSTLKNCSKKMIKILRAYKFYNCNKKLMKPKEFNVNNCFRMIQIISKYHKNKLNKIKLK